MVADEIRFVADIPRVHGRDVPDRVALWFEGRETTYAELDRLSSQCAGALIAAGVMPGERVGVLAKGNSDFFVLWMGCVKARACLTPVNWRLAPPEMAFIVGDAGCRLLFTSAAYAEAAEGLLRDCPALESVIQFEDGHAEWPGFDAWLAGQPDTDPNLPAAPDDDVIQLYTSGTTGLPKGVQLTEGNFRAAFDSAVGAWCNFEPGSSVLVAMPLFHIAGANVGLLALLQGCKAVVMREVDPAAILTAVETHEVAHALLVPAVINMLLQHPAMADADVSSLVDVYYGASPISDEVLLRAQARFGCRFTQVYGLTETIGMATMLPPEVHDPALGKLRSCGRPSPLCEVRVRVDGREAEPFEVGEVEIRGPGVMKGYWNRPEATAQAIDADGWFKSGDAAYFDNDGFLYIHDRVKDMIVSGGENIYPAEVENALFSHPHVADAAVIGVPDEKWGEAVKAVIVLRPGTDPDADALISHCRERIAAYKTPKSVDFIAVLPRNPSGKVLRRELREPYWQGHDRRVG